MPSVALVSMPFMDAERPSIQLGLLKAIGEQHGHPVATVHANLDLAARIGVARYRRLVEHRGAQVGDWLFSVEAFGDAAPDPGAALLDDFAAELTYLGGTHEEVRQWLTTLRTQELPAYLDALVEAYPWGQAEVVGFSSSFQQNTASIALAHRLKARFPQLVTVFGGANFDGEMGPELVRVAECIDVAVVGEADDAFPRLLGCLDAGEDLGAVPGVISRGAGGALVFAAPAAPTTRLDDLPTPAYEEYFESAARLGVIKPSRRRLAWLPIETSRGCWWGAKHHCVFCGLNSTAMTYRSKSPGRVATELAELARRSGSFRFAAVDNILDQGYLTSLLPSLVAAETGYDLFFEVKSNLTRAQVALLARAGVRHLQPGLESLSSNVLRVMNKGVTAAQNVNLLRWARYHGIDVAWNILWGIPGETEADYAEQARTVAHLAHLQPPGSVGRVWLERFSPMFSGTASKRAERSYGYVYPVGTDLDRVAYFFDYERPDALPAGAYDDLAAGAKAWQTAWAATDRPTLEYRHTAGYLQVRDDRRPGRGATHTFEGAAAELYRACSDRPRTATGLGRELELDPAEVDRLVSGFAEAGLMFRDEGRALALALPAVDGR